VSGHSVGAADEKIIGPSVGRGPASLNGHCQHAPEVISKNSVAIALMAIKKKRLKTAAGAIHSIGQWPRNFRLH
jgi:hypothetical protein